LVDDVERAQEFHLRVTLPGFAALTSGVFTLAVAFWIDLDIFIALLPIFLLFTILIPGLVRRSLDPVATAIEDSENIFATEIAQAAHAMVEAEIYGYGAQYRSELTATAVKLEAAESRLINRTSILQWAVLITSGITLASTTAWLHSQRDLLPIEISMSIFLILVGFEGYTSWFPNLFIAGKNRRAASTIESFVDKSQVPVIATSRPQGHEVIARDVLPFWSEKFLAPINFTVEPGQTLVITGPSGTGKSTLAGALFGFADYSGSLTIGGVEVAEIGDLSHYISGTLQNGYIFNTSFRENLKIADHTASDAKLLELITAMELDAIALDEILGEFGRTLSGGEAKRLAIARALLSPAPILILDEPLEHLDASLAERIQRAITGLLDGRSLIVITHAPWLQYSRLLELARE
jgi:ABC-type transport system involved in cytochrome bd biosynthesis fused ATPase/permease subunit